MINILAGRRYTIRNRIRRFIVSKLINEIMMMPRYWGDPERVSIHPSAQVNDSLFNVSCGEIHIGAHAFTGHGVMFLTGTHDWRSVGRSRMTEIPSNGRDIHIGAGVWVGSGAIIIGPCRIGENSVVAAGAIVTKDIPANSLAIGVPAIYRPLDIGAEAETRISK